MQLERALLGRAIRLLPAGGEIYALKLARACETRYGFLQGPRTAEDFDFNRGVTFLHGYFDDRIVIDKFQIFQNGLLVESKADTDECDAFLDDALTWLTAGGSASISRDKVAPRFYASNLEIRASFSLAEKLYSLNKIGVQISRYLQQYGQESIDYELVSLAFAAGAGAAPTFRFERREGAPGEALLYFSAAPLRTSDHLQLLTQLESALTSQGGHG
jgi:hypothetical protein